MLASLLVNRRVDTLLRTALDTVQGSALKPVTALPPAVRRRLAGAPIQIDGRVLDPDLQLLLRLEGLLPGTTKRICGCRPSWAFCSGTMPSRNVSRKIASTLKDGGGATYWSRPGAVITSRSTR